MDDKVDRPEGPDMPGRPERPDMPESRKKNYMLRRSILDYGMGAIIFGFGIFFLLAPRLHIPLSIDDTYRYIFSGLCLLYGGFRVYRGSRKDYFNN